jgi:hypothetical protein
MKSISLFKYFPNPLSIQKIIKTTQALVKVTCPNRIKVKTVFSPMVEVSDLKLGILGTRQI